MAEADAGPILITGTSGEIGSALAAHFVERGVIVLGLDKQEPRPGGPGGVMFRCCDLTDGAHVTAVIDELVAVHGVPGVVVNCAGRIANSPLVSLGTDGWHVHDFELWDDVIRSSLYAAFHVSAVAAKHMLVSRKRGVIINFSSISARGNPGQAAYSAAKAGLNGLTMALAKELGPVGIRVVGIAPGYFDTRSTTCASNT